MKKLFASLLLALCGVPAFAYTDCSNMTITQTQTQVISGVAHYMAATNSGVWIDLVPTVTGYADLVSRVETAHLGGYSVGIRFTAGSVSCTTYALRSDVELVAVY